VTTAGEIYRDYLSCLNERRFSDLGDYVANDLSYNGKRMTLAEYRALLENDVDATPDLHYDAELLVADDHVVACRLLFRCTPRRSFLGFEPTGQQLAFAEHVFYRFEEGRIVDVWSLIDRETIREQLQRGG
jgi:predicted ester cyclase